MDNTRTFTGMISDIIERETKYLRHYIGKVADNIDPDSRGKILVKCDDLGWDTNDTAAWCFPRQLHCMTVPAIGEYVEIYFIMGDVDRPVYMGQCGDVSGNLAKAWDNKPSTHVLFQSPKTTENIIYDEILKRLTADATEILLGKGATEAGVLGTALKSWLETHTHPTAAAGAPSPPTQPVIGILSTKVKLV